MTREERIAILGGTFTPIHNGHRALLHKAFQTASHVGEREGHVIVALTSSALAKDMRSSQGHAELIGEYQDRRTRLEDELSLLSGAYPASHEVIKLEDTWGPAATRNDVDALIVSPEAKAQQRAHELNQDRSRRGLKPLEVHTAPFVVAEDGVRISSSRIRDGEIDEHGRLLNDA